VSDLGRALEDLQELTERLRRDCPWDREQTARTIVPHTVEEAYEVADAAIARDDARLADELGDLLFQVYFLALLLEERGAANLAAIAGDVHAKLVRRHPHVFADVTVSGADEVKQNWDQIKAAERAAATGQPASALDGVPMGQPALSLATQLQRRAAGAGAPSELADLPVAWRPDEPGSAGAASSVGAELFALAARARAAGLDPELELRQAARVYRERVRAWERRSGS
jgi:MazG family protein